jgi:hypothetical protein
MEQFFRDRLFDSLIRWSEKLHKDTSRPKPPFTDLEYVPIRNFARSRMDDNVDIHCAMDAYNSRIIVSNTSYDFIHSIIYSRGYDCGVLEVDFSPFERVRKLDNRSVRDDSNYVVGVPVLFCSGSGDIVTVGEHRLLRLDYIVVN